MTKVFRHGEDVYVERAGSNDYVVVRPGSIDPTIAYNLPSYADELVTEDEVDTTSSYDDGYDAGYADGEDAGYTYDDLEDARSEGYDEGFKDGKVEGYDEGYESAREEAEANGDR